MPQKRHTVDQIVAKLRKADVELGKGKKVPEICKLHRALGTQNLLTIHQLLGDFTSRIHWLVKHEAGRFSVAID